MENLFENVKVTRVVSRNAGTAGVTVKGTILDMQGYEGVLLITAFQDVVNGAVVSLKAAEADSNSSGAMAVLSGSTDITADAASLDNKLLVLDVLNPAKRYVEPQISVATQNAPIDGVVAIQYGARKAPVTPGATIAASKTLLSPVEV